MQLWNCVLVWLSRKYFRMSLRADLRRAPLAYARFPREFLRRPPAMGVSPFTQPSKQNGVCRLGQTFHTDIAEAVFGVQHFLFPHMI